jgi:hypothetical protein
MNETKEFTLTNSQPRGLGLTTGHVLLPGENTVKLTNQQYAVLKDDKTFKSWRKLGWIKSSDFGPLVSQTPVKVRKNAKVDITVMQVDDARQCIGGITDLDKLAKAVKDETRPSVLAAADTQRLILEEEKKDK